MFGTGIALKKDDLLNGGEVGLRVGGAGNSKWDLSRRTRGAGGRSTVNKLSAPLS